MDSEPIQGVFQTYTGRRWKAWEYHRWVEEGLIGEMEDPFEAVKWQQVFGGEGFLRQLKDRWNQRAERPKNYGQKRIWQLSEPSSPDDSANQGPRRSNSERFKEPNKS